MCFYEYLVFLSFTVFPFRIERDPSVVAKLVYVYIRIACSE
nr:MAG TPA: hypothetical protein [Caudoviricetes sp.]